MSRPDTNRHVCSRHVRGWAKTSGMRATGGPALGHPALGHPALGRPALGRPAVGGYTLMELMVSLTLAAVLMGFGAGAVLSLGKKTVYGQALADAAGLINKARNGSIRHPAALVADKAVVTDDGRTIEQLYGRTEQVLQELHFEPRDGGDDGPTFASGINGLDVDATLGILEPRGGRVGGGLRLNGSGIDARAYPPYDVMDGMYLEIWVKPDRLGSSTLIDKGGAFSVRLNASNSAGRVEARIGVNDNGIRDERAVSVAIPGLLANEWVGIFVSYDRKALVVSTDHGYGPVERGRADESRPLKPDVDANLMIGMDFIGTIDDFRFGGVTVEDPITLQQGVAIDGPAKTIHFRGGKLDSRIHPGVETLRLSFQGKVTVLEIGPSGTVQRIYEDDGSGEAAGDGEPTDGGGGSGAKEE